VWLAPRLGAARPTAILVVEATHYVAERLSAAVAKAGIEGMRARYGFVIRAVDGSPLTLTALVERLDVTKQAPIKVVDEMEAAGFVERAPHPHDRSQGDRAHAARGSRAPRRARRERPDGGRAATGSGR
jgi:hypothetical protein